MRIRDLLNEKSICLNQKADSKEMLLDRMVDLMAAGGNLKDKEAYRKGVYLRESESTTGIGEGIAIPHCKSEAVKRAGLAAVVIPDGVEFDSLDGAPVTLAFMIAAPNTKDNIHLDVLSQLSVLLMNEEFTANLRNAKTVEEFLRIIDAAESASGQEDKDTGTAMAEILAVTGCPTGIAHTYMAAEALEKKAKELGIQIKVETRGSGGAKNILTDEEIANAACIIVAADTKVPMERFDGKPVLECRVADGINKAGELIEKARKQEAPVYHASEQKASLNTDMEKQGIGHEIYTHLMSGVSHMLPFVIGGGIMIALAFLIDSFAGFGASGGGDFGNCTPLSSFFKYIGGLAMGLMVPVLAGYIAYSIADRPGLAVGFTGGLLASSGNAIAANFPWAAETTGFQKFVADFAFQGADAGSSVSGFLGGIAAGFLAGYIVLLLKKLCRKLPEALDGIKPTLIYPLGGIFILGVLMSFIFNPLIGMINTGLSTMLSSIAAAGMITVLGLILGGMMAIDMGGPINKAAYVFGIGMLGKASELMAEGATASDPAVQACYIAMAAIMIGGMVPPVGIAIACQLFPKKFTKAERNSKISNLVMGCSFITEGAIPFAAADPIHVIPCTLVGAAVAGFLSALSGCTLMAPHGGIFVFATVGNPLMYIVSWLVGSVITAVMLGLLKKDVTE